MIAAVVAPMGGPDDVAPGADDVRELRAFWAQHGDDTYIEDPDGWMLEYVLFGLNVFRRMAEAAATGDTT